MKFKDLAELFSKLESTSKRLEMIEILSIFFQKLKISGEYDDLDKIAYLLQGQLVSNIKQAPKIGIAEKMIIEALSLHSGVESSKIKEVLIKKGDIGVTAEYILSKKKKQKSLFDFSENLLNNKDSLDIHEIYSALKRMSTTEGSGSNDKKLGILRGLMRKCSALETNYLLRIITSTLRVGVSTLTILDGLALGITGDKINREYIEKAYNLHPDLGDITRMLVEEGMDAIKKVKVSYGIPIKSMLASRVPYGEIMEKLGSPFKAEYKLDGERLQIHKRGNKIKLFSRRLLEISDQYPDVCKFVKNNVKTENAILEGEVVAMDVFYENMLPFQVLSRRRRKYDVKDVSKEIPVGLFLFDILLLDDESYIDKPFPLRRKKLEEIINEKDEIKLVESKLIHSTEELLEFFQEARKKGNEGIIAKSIKEDAVYQAGNRGFLWIKMKGLEGRKLKDSVDVVLIGAFHGRGRRKGVYGTYIGAVYDPLTDKFEAFTRIASGWTDEIMEFLKKEMEQHEVDKKPKNISCKDIPDQWFLPKVVIEIIGDEITMSDKFPSLGYSLRFPVFQRIRHEKGPKDITTIDEIKHLYSTQ
ncbi:MAG: ATP-dependent DNA ligase [Promethearchaeota archaeon]